MFEENVPMKIQRNARLERADAGDPGRYLDGAVEVGVAGPMGGRNLPGATPEARFGSAVAGGRGGVGRS
jgi:hypothetical protein